MATNIKTTTTEIFVFLHPQSSALSLKLLRLNGVKISFQTAINEKLAFYIMNTCICFFWGGGGV